MSDPLELARSCVWYVEARQARSADERPAMGSAVVIRARSLQTKEVRNYLITCAHVVKSGSTGYGKGKLRAQVLCWRPGWGYMPYTTDCDWPEQEHDGIYAATVLDLWGRSTDQDWDTNQCRDVADWVLLDISEANFQDMPYLKIAQGKSSTKSISVIGYPDGSNAWHKSSLVDSVVSSDFKMERREIVPGIVRLDAGEGAAPGMSGGAVLDAAGNLIGLYRGQSPSHLSKVAIQFSSICEALREKGFECVVETPKPLRWFKHWPIAAAVSTVILLVCVWIALWPRVPYAELVSDGDERRLPFLIEPAGEPPQGAEVVELDATHRYEKEKRFLEQSLYKVDDEQELVLTQYELTGPAAELVILEKGSYCPLQRVTSTDQQPAKISSVVPAGTTLALRANDSGIIRFRATGYLRESTAYMQTVIKIRAALLSQASNFSWSNQPLADCMITTYPIGFEPKQILPAKTDENGMMQLAISHATDLEHMRVYFQVAKVSPQLESLQPLLPLNVGVVNVGSELRQPYSVPAELVVGEVQERDLQVIPYSQFDTIARPMVSRSLVSTTTSTGSTTASGSTSTGAGTGVAAPLNALAGRTGLAPQAVEQAIRSWVGQLNHDRPVIPMPKIIDDSFPHEGIDDWERIKVLASKVGPAVCAVLPKTTGSSGGQSSYGTGFLIAKDTVLCASGSELSEGAFISFANEPSVDQAKLPMKQVLVTFGNFAILDVPGCPEAALTCQFSSITRESPSILVLGFPIRDSRLPEDLQVMFAEQDHPVKMVMPGVITPVPEGQVNAEGFDLMGHDATTSAGTMGGPIIDQQTGHVVGLHVGGRWGGVCKSNTAIPLNSLLSNDEVRAVLKERGAKAANTVAMVQNGAPSRGFQQDFLQGVQLPMPESTNEQASLSELLTYEHYSVVINRSRGLAAYAAANLDRSRMHSIDSLQEMRMDSRLPAYEQIGPNFYTDNEFDGWQIIGPRWIAWGDADEAASASSDAYRYTNIAPQYNWFNQKAWNRLEKYVLEEMSRSSKQLSVFAGPVLAQDDLEYRGRKIPKEYWLIAIAENSTNPSQPIIESWIVPQFELVSSVPVAKPLAKDVIQNFRVPVAEIERRTQLKFAESVRNAR